MSQETSLHTKHSQEVIGCTLGRNFLSNVTISSIYIHNCAYKLVCFDEKQSMTLLFKFLSLDSFFSLCRLILLGLMQYPLGNDRQSQYRLICQNMLPIKTNRQVMIHVKNMCCKKRNSDNIIRVREYTEDTRKFKQHQQLYRPLSCCYHVVMFPVSNNSNEC